MESRANSFVCFVALNRCNETERRQLFEEVSGREVPDRFAVGCLDWRFIAPPLAAAGVITTPPTLDSRHCCVAFMIPSAAVRGPSQSYGISAMESSLALVHTENKN
jgi:hypothetical protein